MRSKKKRYREPSMSLRPVDAMDARCGAEESGQRTNAKFRMRGSPDTSIRKERRRGMRKRKGSRGGYGPRRESVSR